VSEPNGAPQQAGEGRRRRRRRNNINKSRLKKEAL